MSVIRLISSRRRRQESDHRVTWRTYLALVVITLFLIVFIILWIQQRFFT